MILSAIAPLPENVPELLLTSLLTGKKLSRAHSSEFAIDPVAEAEFLIVGESPPHVRKLEGPFGDHYGYYSLAHDFPVLNVKKIYHRKNAIFPATIVGKPRQEDFYLGDYLQELLSPMIKLVMPTVDDLWSYGETGYHCLSSCVIKKERYGREVLTTCFRILGEGQLSLTKFLLVLDKDIDLRDFRKVLTYVLERFDAKKDLNIFCETAYDTLDYTSQKLNFGSKGVLIGIGDPIRKLPESFSKEISSTLISKAKVFSPGCLVVQGKNYSEDKNLAKTLSEQKTLQDWPMIILVDDVEKTCRTVTSFLWTAFTRFEPARDIYANYQTHHHKNQYELPIVIDARMKPWFPKELFCDEDTKKLVDRRWQEYFPNNKIAMGSSDEGHLYL